MAKNIRTTRENSTGRNTNFVNTTSGEQMNRSEFVRQIDQGRHPDYHTRTINGVRTPVSNPDRSKGNNLD